MTIKIEDYGLGNGLAGGVEQGGGGRGEGRGSMEKGLRYRLLR
jgi:hypothetical protein